MFSTHSGRYAFPYFSLGNFGLLLIDCDARDSGVDGFAFFESMRFFMWGPVLFRGLRVVIN